jgi:hypothetical protein
MQDDNNTQTPSSPPQPPTPIPEIPNVSAPTQPAPTSSYGGMKVIQPISSDLTIDTVPTTPPTATALPAEQAQPATPVAQDLPFNTPPPRPVAPSSVYPDPTQGFNATNNQVSSPADNKKDTKVAYNFDSGYLIGGSIFWNQLIAGIIFGVIFYGITASVLKTAGTSLINIVGLLHYVAEYLVFIYVPYRVLRSNAEDEPLWLTLFGVATQSVIVACAFELVSLVIIKAILNHGVSSSISHIGSGGIGALAILVYIGFIIASYFLTKLSWGIAYSLFSKIKNKMIVKAIGIGILAIIVGGIGYHYLTLSGSTSKNGISLSTASTVCQSNGLCNYKVSGTPSYSADFYKGAKVINNKKGQGLIDYDPVTLGQGVHIGVAVASPSASCSSAETNSTFAIQVQGMSNTVCVFNSTASNLVSYTSYVQLNGRNYVITMISYSYKQNPDTIKAIFNSIAIN